MARTRLTNRIPKTATLTEGLDQIASKLEKMANLDRISDIPDKEVIPPCKYEVFNEIG
jgi:hypothetical protein